MGAIRGLGPIGQISCQVSDIGQAVRWYRDVLGLPHLYTYGDLAFFDCHGVRLYLGVPEDGAPPGRSSVIYFRVDDIQATYADLVARGVEFRTDPAMVFRHDSGPDADTEEWMAFFVDPDGNLLAIMEQRRR